MKLKRSLISCYNLHNSSRNRSHQVLYILLLKAVPNWLVTSIPFVLPLYDTVPVDSCGYPLCHKVSCWILPCAIYIPLGNRRDVEVRHRLLDTVLNLCPYSVIIPYISFYIFPKACVCTPVNIIQLALVSSVSEATNLTILYWDIGQSFTYAQNILAYLYKCSK